MAARKGFEDTWNSALKLTRFVPGMKPQLQELIPPGRGFLVDQAVARLLKKFPALTRNQLITRAFEGCATGHCHEPSECLHTLPPCIFITRFNISRRSVAIQALFCKPEDTGFETRWCNRIHSVYLIFPATLFLGVYSANNNQYQRKIEKSFLRVSAVWGSQFHRHLWADFLESVKSSISHKNLGLRSLLRR
jgi:hypothetical protein